MPSLFFSRSQVSLGFGRQGFRGRFSLLLMRRGERCSTAYADARPRSVEVGFYGSGTTITGASRLSDCLTTGTCHQIFRFEYGWLVAGGRIELPTYGL